MDTNHCLPELTRKSKRMGRIINCGYVYIYKPSHPRASSHSGYVGEHVLVAELTAGRLLVDGEQVHHVDGNKLNNTPENLAVVTAAEHARIHSTKPRMILMTCACCGSDFHRRYNNVVNKLACGQTDFYCDRKCMAKSFGRGRAKQPP